MTFDRIIQAALGKDTKQANVLVGFYNAKRKDPEITAYKYLQENKIKGNSVVTTAIQRMRAKGYNKECDTWLGETLGRPRVARTVNLSEDFATPTEKTIKRTYNRKPKMLEIPMKEVSLEELRNHKIKKIISELLDIL